MKNLDKLLDLIIPHIKKYYGEEYNKIIDEAINSCYFYFEDSEKTNDELKKFMEEFFPNKFHEQLPYLTQAFFDSCPIITENGLESKRIIYVRKSNLNIFTLSELSIFVHELLHLIKSYVNEYYIKDDNIIQRSGISNCILKNENGKFKEYKIEYNAFDEVINIYDESMIMSSILDREYITDCYFETIKISQLMFSNFSLDIKTKLKKSLLLGTNDFIEKIGEENFNYLANSCDSFIQTYVFNSEDIKKSAYEYIENQKEKRQKECENIVNYFKFSFSEKCNNKKY